MKHIIVPAPIALPDVGKTIAFKEFITGALLNDQKFSKTIAALKSAAAIEAAMDAIEGDILKIHDNDWTLLKEVAETPTNGYGPAARYCLAFLDAILEAKSPPAGN